MKFFRAGTLAGLLPLALGCAGARSPVSLALHEPLNPRLPASQRQWVTVEPSQQPLAISRFAALTERDLLRAEVVEQDGRKALELHFDAHGAAVLYELTMRLRGQPVAVFVNGRPVAAVRVPAPRDDGVLRVSGEFTDEQLWRWQSDLNRVAARRRDRGDVAHQP
jgi:preprotein translocase subunit SecD